jgi:hypothetical protein
VAVGVDASEPIEAAAEIQQACACALAFLNTYRGPEKDQIPFQILLALAKESDDRLEAGVPPEKVTFDAIELTNLVRNVAVVEGPPAGKESTWVTKHWNKLDKQLAETEELWVAFARDQGFRALPVLHKQQSRGGPGRRSQYRLLARALPIEADAARFSVPYRGLRYQVERRKRIPWIGRLYIGGTIGPVRSGFLFLILALFLLGGVAVWSPVVLRAFVPIEVDLVDTIFGLMVIGGLFHILFGPLSSVTRWKVAALPLLFQPLDEQEALLLEDARNPADAKARRRIDLVKYTGDCPVCGGRVVVGSGGLRFWARLVGRCQRSPREHVFSFDHVTKVGRPLSRQPARLDQSSA